MGYVKETYLKNKLVKVKRSLEATVEDIQHHALLIIRKKPRYMIIHAGTNHPSRSNSRKICSRFLQPKKDKLPDIELILSTAALRTGNGKALLILRQVTKYLVKLNIEFLISIRPKKMLLFSKMRVTRKIFTRTAANFFVIHFPDIFSFVLQFLLLFLYFCFFFFLLICLFFENKNLYSDTNSTMRSDE